MRTADRVLVNTLALYLNMGVTMGVTLLATRFALQALGKEAYGVYMLVANITAMLSFLNVAMAGATQRFLSYSLGAAGEGKKLGQIFYTSIVLHLIIAAVLSVAILLLGGLGIACLLDIPAPLTQAAYVVLAGLAAGVVFSVVSVPYEAAMNAHEDIYQIAGINIIDASLKMLATCALFLFEEDRLQIYALLIMCIGGITYLLKRTFSPDRGGLLHRRRLPLRRVRRLSGVAAVVLHPAPAGAGRRPGRATRHCGAVAAVPGGGVRGGVCPAVPAPGPAQGAGRRHGLSAQGTVAAGGDQPDLLSHGQPVLCLLQHPLQQLGHRGRL